MSGSSRSLGERGRLDGGPVTPRGSVGLVAAVAAVAAAVAVAVAATACNGVFGIPDPLLQLPEDPGTTVQVGEVFHLEDGSTVRPPYIVSSVTATRYPPGDRL